MPHPKLIVGLLLLFGCQATAPETSTEPPPPTRREEVVDVLHGVEIVDSYRWLEDQESPETRAWIAAQNAYTRQHLTDRPERAAIVKRLDELMRTDQVSIPIQRGDRTFLWKKKAEDDLWILYLRRGLDGDDEVLIDPHDLSADHTTGVRISDISRDGKLLAYGVRQGGADEVEIRVMDVERRQDLPDRLPPALYRSLSFTADGQGFYYGRRDRGSGVRIRHHQLGTDQADDPEVFGEGYGPGQWIFAEVSDDGRYLLIEISHGWSRSEIFLRDLGAGGPLVRLFDGVEARFATAFAGDRLIVQTDWEAPTGRILAIDLGSPGWTKWREIVPARDDAIQGTSAVAGQIFVHTLHDVRSRIERYDVDGELLGELPLPGAGSASTPSGDWAGDSAFFSFESFLDPPGIYRFDRDGSEVELWNRPKVPFDSADFTTEQVWFTSKDGTRVPMFVVAREGVERDGDRPTLLYGYGGFAVSLRPRFRPLWAWWIERGGVFALANIRGGSEFGEAWHRAGMLENKQNVFDDFIAAAEHLIDSGVTRPRRLAIQGGSNGGLLVGAVTTQRPELYRAVLCQFPDLDMVRYYAFDNNNPPALLEYGDASDPDQFRFLYEYSPYQRVRDGEHYPAVLLTSGDRDTRVPPLQARKMTARLQAATASGRPVYLLYDTEAGHSGGKPLAKSIEDLSIEAVFLASELGL
ncbi:MAG: prolyl oligopeptidase family serine peptidase [Thermoanaerobaculia bacterium]